MRKKILRKKKEKLKIYFMNSSHFKATLKIIISHIRLTITASSFAVINNIRILRLTNFPRDFPFVAASERDGTWKL